MPKAVIFDVDGTLVDSVDFHTESWTRTLAHFGHEIPFETIRFQIGKGGGQILPHLLGQRAADAKGKAMEAWRGDVFKREYLPSVRAFPAVAALFRHIRAAGLKVALASSAKTDELAAYKKLAGIDGLIDAETTSDNAKTSKPHPDVFNAVLRRLGVAPRDAVAVGDTHYDIEAAGKAGMRTIGVLCGGFPEDGLRKAGAVAVYRDPAHLLAAYDASPLA